MDLALLIGLVAFCAVMSIPVAFCFLMALMGDNRRDLGEFDEPYGDGMNPDALRDWRIAKWRKPQ